MGDTDEKGTTSTYGTKPESSSNSTTEPFAEEGYSAQIKLANEPRCQTVKVLKENILPKQKFTEMNPSEQGPAGRPVTFVAVRWPVGLSGPRRSRG